MKKLALILAFALPLSAQVQLSKGVQVGGPSLIPGPTGATGSTGDPGTTTATGANGAFVAKALNYMKSATQYSSNPGVSADGIAAAFATCVSGGSCNAVAEAGYPLTDTTLPTGVGQQLSDTRYGGNVTTISNPYGSQNISQPGEAPGAFLFSGTTCNQQLQPFVVGNEQVHNFCNILQMHTSIPGPNYGGNPAYPTLWNVSQVSTILGRGDGAGILGLLRTRLIKPGLGDSILNDVSMLAYGNSTDPSAEGAKVLRGRYQDASVVPTATVATGTTSTQIYMTPTNDATGDGSLGTGWGVGRFVRKPSTWLTGVGTSFSYADSNRLLYVTDSTQTFPVSTFSGQLTHTILATQEGEYPLGTYGACTNLVFNSGYTGTLTTGDRIEFDTNTHEQASISGNTCSAWVNTQVYRVGEGVTYGGSNYTSTADGNIGNTPGSGGVWTLETVPSGGLLRAATIRYSHRPGQVFANGMAWYGFAFDANKSLSTGLRYPMEIVGSPDAHTLAVAHFDVTQGLFNGDSTVTGVFGRADTESHAINTITVTSGGSAVISMYDNTTRTIALQRQGLVTVTGNSNSALNGQYTYPSDTIGDYQSLAMKFCGSGVTTPCTTYSGTTGTGTGGSITIGSTGYGTTTYTYGPMAKVIDTRDCRQQNVAGVGITSQGTAATLEPNALNLSAGDAIEEDPLYSQQIMNEDVALSVFNPHTSSPGMNYVYMGGDGFADIQGTGQPKAWTKIFNGNTLNQYTGGGGIGFANPILETAGVTGGLLNSDDAPFPYDGTHPLINLNRWSPNTAAYGHPQFSLAQVRVLIPGASYNYCHLIDIDYVTGTETLGTGCGQIKFASNPFASQPLVSQFLTSMGVAAGGTSEKAYLNITLADGTNLLEMGHDGSGSGTNTNYMYDKIGNRFIWQTDTSNNFNITNGISAGGGAVITNTNAIPQVGAASPATGQLVCVKTVGPPQIQGTCTPSISGTTFSCPCN